MNAHSPTARIALLVGKGHSPAPTVGGEPPARRRHHGRRAVHGSRVAVQRNAARVAIQPNAGKRTVTASDDRPAPAVSKHKWAATHRRDDRYHWNPTAVAQPRHRRAPSPQETCHCDETTGQSGSRADGGQPDAGVQRLSGKTAAVKIHPRAAGHAVSAGNPLPENDGPAATAVCPPWWQAIPVSPPSAGFARAAGRPLSGMSAPVAIQPRAGTQPSAGSRAVSGRPLAGAQLLSGKTAAVEIQLAIGQPRPQRVTARSSDRTAVYRPR